jgi:hypothetical protein
MNSNLLSNKIGDDLNRINKEIDKINKKINSNDNL